MTWLVTGAKGQLGKSICMELKRQGIEFTAFDSNQLDISSLDRTVEVVTKLRPQVIVNTAAWTDVDGAESNHERAFKVNGFGVENLIEAAQKTQSTLVQISTDYVFSSNSNLPISEDSPMNPQNLYGKSKAAGESAINKLYAQRSYVIRTAWLYSEFGKNFAKTMAKIAVTTNEAVEVVSDQIGQPTSTYDLSKQVIKLVRSEQKFGVYHGTNGGQASWWEFAQEIFKLSGENADRVIPVDSSKFPRVAKRPSNSVLGNESWSKIGITPMRDWKLALSASMPAILDSINENNSKI